MNRLLGAAALLLLAAGCGCTPIPSTTTTGETGGPPATQRDDAGRQAEGPAASADDKAEAVKGNNAFAFDLYGKLPAKDGNVFLSPASVSTALAMSCAGARGRTEEEMASVLHFTLEPQRLHPAQGALLHDLNQGGGAGRYQLAVANALWGQKGVSFLPDFLELTRTNYGAGVQEVDFGGATEEARRTINVWVEKKTQDRIKDLLQPGNVTSLTKLVLTNAIYFKGDWDVQFKKAQTHDVPFLARAADKVNVPLMNQTGNFPYWEGDGLQVLEMPYKGKDLSMVVLLPKKADGLADLEKLLTADRVAGWLERLHEQKVIVGFPKFHTTIRYSLAGPLAELGMKQAFTQAADFSGMTTEKVGIADVIHKAVVEVNEEGTEAAAATAVVVATPGPVTPVAVFRADHPFVFLIRDRHSGSILFLGRLATPKT
jgi:serpin B